MTTAPFNFPVWKQGDPAWGSQKLGTSNVTLAGFGCLITCLAMQDAGYDPGNPWTPDKVNKAFTIGKGFANGNLVIWGMINRILPNSQHLGADWTLATPAPIQKIRDHIAAGGTCIVQVGFGGKQANMHFLLVIGYDENGLIFHDPYYGDRNNFRTKRYGTGKDSADIFVTHYFRDAIANQPPAPAVAPAPVVSVAPATPAPAPAPAAPEPAVPAPAPVIEPEPTPEPTPAPVIEPVVETNVEDPEPARTWPIKEINPHAWVQVIAEGGAPIINVATGKELELVPNGTKFKVTHFAAVETAPDVNIYYLVSEKMSYDLTTQGIRTELLAKSTVPTMDNIATKTTLQGIEISLDDFGKFGRTILKSLHVLFGDWEIFKFFSKNKEKK